MAITTTEQTAVMKTVSALFNKAFTPETTTKFFNFYEANGKDLAKLADGLIGSASYTSLYAGAGTPAEFGTILMAKYGMTYGGTSAADTAMTNFITYSFDNAADNNSTRTIQAVDKYITATLLPSITTGNVFETMNTAIANKAEVAIAFKNSAANAGKELDLSTVTADPATKDKYGVITSQIFTLTEGRDNKVGTSGDDTFYGDVGQNTLGAVSNALDSGDMIDGGAGRDTIVATMIEGYKVDNNGNTLSPMPRIDNVEEIRLQAMEDTIVDADHITGEEHYASDSSRKDLTITNVDITSTQITKDIKLEMKDTQQNSDFAVYFDDQALIAKAAEAKTTAQYFLKVGDGEATDASPISNVKIDITLNHNGNVAKLDDIKSTDGTYAGLVAAINAALIADGLGSKYSVELGDAFTEIITTKETTDANGFDILITSLEEVKFAKNDMNFSIGTVNSNVANLIVSNADVLSNTVISTSKIESDIIVDNVGRGSNGGEIVIGSTSSSDSSKGVEVINVEVRKSSIIHDISTTNDDNVSWDGLQEITLKNGTGYTGDFVLTNANYQDNTIAAGALAVAQLAYDTTPNQANLTALNDAQAYYDSVSFDKYNNVDNQTFKEGLDKITATNFEGNIVLGRDNDIVNLGTLSANVNGNVTLNATYDGDTLPSDKQAFVVVTGSGNDTITADVTGNSTSNSTDTSLTINAGSGDNTITLSSDTTEDTKVTVTTGSGTDTVTGGETHLTVNTGAGNDVIYAENTGATKAAGSLAAAAVAANVSVGATLLTTGPTGAGNVQSTDLLYGRDVRVTLNFEDAVAAEFTDGFEATAAINASNGYLTTERDLYQAAADAINNDAVLNKLAEASIDSNGDLTVTYLVDGLTTNTNNIVKIDVIGKWDDASSNNAKILNALKKEYNDSGILLVDLKAAYLADVVNVAGVTQLTTGITDTTAGADSALLGGANTITAGTGNDVIVLSSDVVTSDTVVFEAGNFGHDTIVNFDTISDGGLDVLDFTDWLDVTWSHSGSITGESDSRSTTVLDSAATLITGVSAGADSNIVSVIDFATLNTALNGTAVWGTGTMTFETMSALSSANMTTVLNTYFDTTNLDGRVTKNIIMIENTAVATQNVGNDGEYTVVQAATAATHTIAADGFQTVSIVGSVDFGQTETIAIGDLA